MFENLTDRARDRRSKVALDLLKVMLPALLAPSIEVEGGVLGSVKLAFALADEFLKQAGEVPA